MGAMSDKLRSRELPMLALCHTRGHPEKWIYEFICTELFSVAICGLCNLGLPLFKGMAATARNPERK